MDNWIKNTQEQIRNAAAAKRRLRIMGHDSLRDWVPDDDPAQAISTHDHVGVVNYEPSELVVTVRSGTRLQELQETLAQQNQCLPFDPPTSEQRTVGGMVACGFAGSTRVSAGSVRDYVLGVHVINGRGELLQLGGQVMKNVAGYDLGRLYAGSWGTLGVMAQVSLKVMPIPPADLTLSVMCTVQEAMVFLNQARPQPWPLAASLWVGRGHEQGQLFLRWRGAQASVTLAHQSWCQHMQREGKPHETLCTEDAQIHWAAWRDMRSSFFDPAAHLAQDLWRTVVPWETSVATNLAWHAVDWHGGLRWQWRPQNERQEFHAQSVQQRLRTLRVPSSSDRASEHPLSWLALNAAEQRLQQRVQSSLDPQAVFLPASLKGIVC